MPHVGTFPVWIYLPSFYHLCFSLLFSPHLPHPPSPVSEPVSSHQPSLPNVNSPDHVLVPILSSFSFIRVSYLYSFNSVPDPVPGSGALAGTLFHLYRFTVK